jgi:hypothetical protein
VTGWKVDIRTTEFGINLEANVGAVLTFGIGDMFHLIALRRDTKHCIGNTFDLTIQSILQSEKQAGEVLQWSAICKQ